LLGQLDRWQEQARAEHPNVIPCRLGCDACCHGPFDISVADVELVVEAVAALPEDARLIVRREAERQAAAMVALEPTWGLPFEVAQIGEARFDRVSDALADLPCPLLDQRGGCRIYPRRPMICRMMGLGLATEAGDVIENGCPIQDRFPGYAALPPRPFPLAAWEAALDEVNAAAAERLLGDPNRAGYETTIAGAVVAWTVS
jgi:Fe-S-cluster containining protein